MLHDPQPYTPEQKLAADIAEIRTRISQLEQRQARDFQTGTSSFTWAAGAGGGFATVAVPHELGVVPSFACAMLENGGSIFFSQIYTVGIAVITTTEVKFSFGSPTITVGATHFRWMVMR